MRSTECHATLFCFAKCRSMSDFSLVCWPICASNICLWSFKIPSCCTDLQANFGWGPQRPHSFSFIVLHMCIPCMPFVPSRSAKHGAFNQWCRQEGLCYVSLAFVLPLVISSSSMEREMEFCNHVCLCVCFCLDVCVCVCVCMRVCFLKNFIFIYYYYLCVCVCLILFVW